MYTQHFDLTEKPFNVTPNPRFVFLSKQHREVFAHLLYGLQNRCGFIEITGEVGAGKTTTLRTLFHQLKSDEYRLALIFNPTLSADELLEAICMELGIPVVKGDRRGLLDHLNQYLLTENAAGRTVVLVIDEAQNLAVPVLEQIRLLSNLETETDKLIQIVLVGQPELGDLLAQPNLRQFSQRISVRYHLRPMDQDDSFAYIRHRLSVAGGDPDIFTNAACKSIYKLSRGLPRLINILCDRALLAAYSEDRNLVSRKDTQKAYNELLRKKPARLGPILYGVALCGLIVVAVLLYMRPVVPEVVKAPVSGAGVMSETEAPVVDDSAFVQQIRHSLANIEESQSFAGTIQSLLTSWHIETGTQVDHPAEMTNYLQTLPDSGWEWTAYSGDLQTLLNLDVPTILELSLPAVSGRRYLLIESLSADSVQISFSNQARRTVSVNVLSSLYTGRAYILWRNYLQLSSFSQLGQHDIDISQIQNMLAQAGYYSGPVTGIYDTPTIQAVTRLQADRGVVQDGRIGPLTMMLLYQQGGTFNSPRLADHTPGGRL
jgi:general secretion pathway protein A